jgi:hypothetical protein
MGRLNRFRWIATAAVCLVAVGLLAGLLTQASAGEKKYTLEYKLKKGTDFGMATTTERKSTREMMGNEIKATTTDKIGYDAKVTQVKDGVATIEVTYMDRSHDSDDPQVKMDTDFSGLLGKTAEFDMTPRGELSNFEGFDALPELAISGGQATHGASQYINELKEFFIQLPADPVGVGDTWSYTEEFNEPVEGGSAKVVINYTYKVDGVEKRNGQDCLKLIGDYTTEVSGDGNAQGMAYTIGMSGEGSETAYFAYKKGMLSEVETNSYVEGAVNADDVGFEMPMRHDYTSKRMYTLK